MALLRTRQAALCEHTRERGLLPKQWRERRQSSQRPGTDPGDMRGPCSVPALCCSSRALLTPKFNCRVTLSLRYEPLRAACNIVLFEGREGQSCVVFKWREGQSLINKGGRINPLLYLKGGRVATAGGKEKMPGLRRRPRVPCWRRAASLATRPNGRIVYCAVRVITHRPRIKRGIR